MFPWLDLLKFIAGLVAIIKGADYFTEAAVWVANRTGVPKVIIGATIVSLATTLPEFAVSSYAAYTGHPSMAVGNAIGSGICNIGLILGLTLIIKDFPVLRSSFVGKGLFMIGSAIFLYILSLDNVVSRTDGLLMLTILAGFVIYTIREVRQNREHISSNAQRPDKKTVLPNTLKFLAGALSVVVGSRIVVGSGVVLAEFYNIPEIIIALTLIAFGTSLPELVTSLVATIKGHQDLSIGNIMGANLLNMTWVVGGSALVNPLEITKTNLSVDFPVLGLLMLALLIFGVTKDRLNRLEGSTLFAMYAGYITYLVVVTF